MKAGHLLRASKLKHTNDPINDLMTICGIRYSGEFLRMLGEGGMDLNVPIAVVSRKDGVIIIKTFNKKELTEALLNA